jgi:hypothetical protein
MAQGRKHLKTTQSLGEQEICDLFSDELSDVPSDIFSDNEPTVGMTKKNIWT